MKTRKGQAALEFLTTYGWAILVLLAVLGVLIYSGMFDISNKIPESCNFNSGTSCDSFSGLKNGNFAFEITNMQRAAINITNVSCSYTSDFGNYIINLTQTTVKVGDSAVIFCNASHAINTTPDVFSGKHKFQAKVYYHFDEIEALPKVMSGDLVIKVSDDSSLLQQYIDEAIPEIN